MGNYWLKQQEDKPLFEDVLWMKPENPHQRPKVLIIGGSPHGLATTIKLYDAIKSKAAYQTKVAMPRSVEKIIGTTLDDAVFVDSTPSGEISVDAKTELLAMLGWAQAVVISDDLGNNSQTELMLPGLVQAAEAPVFVLGHSIELIQKSADDLAGKDNLIILGNVSEAARFTAHTSVALQNSDGLVQFIDKLERQSKSRKYSVVTLHQDRVVVSNSRASTSKISNQTDWGVRFVAQSIQFAKNFDSQQFEALTTGAYLAQGSYS